MFKWYKFKPVDTLFFRGAEPMEMGESHVSTPVFPPAPHTIAGALRTTVLIQNEINFDEYKNDNFDKEDIIKSIGKYSEKAPFDVVGPLFMQNENIFIPAPYSWYMDSNHKKNLKEQKTATVKIIKSNFLKSNLIKTGKPNVYWAKPLDNELVSLGGYWMKMNELSNNENNIEVYSLSYFIEFEQRIGIALENNRKVRESHIYSFNHTRLKGGCELIFGINKALPINKNGILKLGAEQRFGRYEILDDNIEFQPDGNLYMSLSIVPKSEEANKNIIATGKIIYLGGWDLAKGFHKDMIGYFPSGSVFRKKINNNCIAIN